MAYDVSKDAVLAEVGEVEITDSNRLFVRVRQYGNGEPKVAIERTVTSRSGERLVAAGRLCESELEAVLPLLNEALEHF